MTAPHFIAESIDRDALELQARGEDLDAMARALPLQGVSAALEVGSGTGAFTRAVAHAAGPRLALWGMDPSRAHVDTANRLAAQEQLTNLRFVHGDILDESSLAPLRGRFDLVFCRYLLMYLAPKQQEQRCLQEMKSCLRPGGTVACLEVDANFGQERFPPPPEPLAAVLARIVPFYREQQLIEWRCGLQLYHHLSAAGLSDVTVRVVDGRIIQGGTPSALVQHGSRDVEELIAPCLASMGAADTVAAVAAEWRDYLAGPDNFLYTPVLMGVGIT